MVGRAVNMHFAGGLPETLCGGGSTMETTAHIRSVLPKLFYDLGIKVLLDAPCGDRNWMKHVDLGAIKYLGADFDSEHIEKADHPGCAVRNIVNDWLPSADLVLSRDFLQHLPTEQAWKALRNFTSTGAKWLLLTSHNNAVNEDIPSAGGFRPLNLQAAPFSFPAPTWSTDDPPGSTRILGLWNAEDIAGRLHSPDGDHR